MSADSIESKLTAFLEADLERMAAAELAGRLVGVGHAAAALELLTELREASRKVASAAVEALPEVVTLLPGEAVATWIDLAISLNEQSGAASIKFCKESPVMLRAMETAVAGPALAMALELAEQDANVALEGFRQASGVAAVAGVETLPLWAQIGADLARVDYVLGIEYIRRGPEILELLAQEDLKAWASVSLKLVTPNSLGKPDYMAALAFFRTSPALLGDLATPAVRRRVLALGGALANHSPEQAVGFLGEAPGWLHRIRDPQWQERVLQYGTLIAERDAAAALAYLRRAPEVIDLADPDAPAPSPAMVGTGGAPLAGPSPAMMDRFDKWYRGGMEVLAYNPEAARAYFAVETRKALEAIEEAASGVALRSVARVLKLFAEGLSGHPVTIRPLDESKGDGSTIALPARMRRYPTKEDNLRMYKVLTAHEAGHLEYGTYDLRLSRLADLAAQAGLRYGRAAASPPTSLEEFFQLYPHPLLISDLWMMAEDARIEACLKAEYPGLRRDMDAVAREEVARRSLTHGMSVRELIVELLLEMSATDPDDVRVPDALADVVERAWALLRVVAISQATAEDVVRAVHRAYVLIEELTAKELPTPPDGASEDSNRPLQPRAGEEQGGAYRPVTTFTHRGVMDAARVREPEQSVGGQADEPSTPALESSRGEPTLSGGSRSQQGPRVLRDAASVPSPVEGRRESASLADDARVIPEEEAGAALPALPGMRTFLYDEWDGRIQDYRTRWCRVVEQTAPEGTEEFIGLVRSRYGGVVSLIRRYFEGIRPPALRRMRRQADGEEVDIEAVVEALVERKAHVSASEFVYIRRDRRDRDVAAAVLVGLRCSTGQQNGPGGARIIDVEKEGFVLLCEAGEANRH